MNGRFGKLVERAKSSVVFWKSIPEVEFLESLTRLMEQRRVSRAELAKAIGSSRSYVTKMLRGDANFTLETMAKAAMALDATVHVHVADKNTTVRWIEEHSSERAVVVNFASQAPEGHASDVAVGHYISGDFCNDTPCDTGRNHSTAWRSEAA